LIARNPEEDSKLPYLLRLPIEGGLVLKARDTWPRSARTYCHPYEADWPDVAEIVEQARVSFIRRRGPVIDLVLDRPRLARSQFVFTETRGRPAIFWQTQKAARAANSGARIPRARAIPEGFMILIDSRERYPYRFTGRDVEIERVALPAGDYAVAHGEAMAAAVERKTFENFTASLSDGTLAFQMQRLGETSRAAVVVEGRYSALFKLEHVSGAWLGDMLARLHVRYPEVQVVFADSRKFAEEWTYRFLAAALADSVGSDVAKQRDRHRTRVLDPFRPADSLAMASSLSRTIGSEPGWSASSLLYCGMIAGSSASRLRGPVQDADGSPWLLRKKDARGDATRDVATFAAADLRHWALSANMLSTWSRLAPGSGRNRDRNTPRRPRSTSRRGARCGDPAGRLRCPPGWRRTHRATWTCR